MADQFLIRISSTEMLHITLYIYIYIYYYYYPQKHTKRISLNLCEQDIEEITEMEIAAMKERSRLRMEAVSPEIVLPSLSELAQPASPEIVPPTSPEIMPQHVRESESPLNSIELPVFGPLLMVRQSQLMVLMTLLKSM